MGWKSVKNHYRIEHIVHIKDGNICIGSGYINDIIVLGIDGQTIKHDGFSNAALARYVAEFKADPALLKSLIEAKDEFGASIPVWTFDDKSIIEQQCEALGWPNVTHDGQLMYDNKHFSTRAAAIEAAKRSAQAEIEYCSREIKQLESSLASMRRNLIEAAAEKDRLSALEQ